MLKKLISYSFLLSLFVGCGSVGIKKNYQTNYKISPGQLVKIEIPSKINRVECGEKSHDISIKENQKFFIYAESYFSKNKNIKCSGLVNGKKSFEVDVQVVQKDYPFETLRVNPKRVKLSKKDLNRVIKERKLLKRVYGNGDKSLLINKSFVHPLKSKITSFYGTRRLFNNVKKSQHLGIDYRAAVGVPIPSSNKGKVVLARNLFYTGNTVIIDHGLGIFTLYGHLNKILVKKGHMANQGEILGHAGKTGRVTGPHLHWGVKVDGHWVDGDILTKLDLP